VPESAIDPHPRVLGVGQSEVEAVKLQQQDLMEYQALINHWFQHSG